MAFAHWFRHPLGDGTITPGWDGDGYWVAQSFDEPNEQLSGSHHLGVDWNVEGAAFDDLGEPVFAIANGTIVDIVSDQGVSSSGFGNYIIMRHDFETPRSINGQLVSHVYSLYAHLDSVSSLSIGAEVSIGQQIGTVGTSGNSASPHLHFEMTIGDVLPTSDDGYNPAGAPSAWIDPVAFIDANLEAFGASGSPGISQAEVIRAGTFIAMASYGGSFLQDFQGTFVNDPANGDFPDRFNYDDDYRGFLESQGWQILTDLGHEGDLDLDLAGLEERGEFTAGGLFRSTEGWVDNEQGEGSQANRGEALVATTEIDGERILVIAFRGSDGIDAALEMQTFTGSGLSDYYIWLRPVIVAVAEYAETSGIETVVVAGHSLGGTLVDLFGLADSDLFDGTNLNLVSLASAGLPASIVQHSSELGLDLIRSVVSEGRLQVPRLPDPEIAYFGISHSEDRVHYPAIENDGDELASNTPLLFNVHYPNSDHIDIDLANIANVDVFYPGRRFYEADRGFGAEHNDQLYWTNIDFLTRDPLFSQFDGSQSITMGIHDYGRALDYTGEEVPLFQAYTGIIAFGVDNDEDSRSLLGSEGANYILGLSGNDSIAGLGGDDLLSGGAGADVLSGGGGTDIISGGSGWDRISGGTENDWLYGDAGNDHLQGDTGQDHLIGGSGFDDLYGGADGDVFIFDITSLASGMYRADQIFDFNQGNSGSYDAGEGDRIDISNLVAEAGGLGQPDNLLWRTPAVVGQDAVYLEVDPDGAGDQFGWQAIAILHGVASGAQISVFTGSTDVSVRAAVSAAGSFSIAPSSRYVSEGGGSLTFTVTRPNASLAETVFISTTIDRGSTNVDDYEYLLNEELTFAPGQLSLDVTIDILDDESQEFPETFGFIIQSSPDQPASQYLASATFTIIDDDFSGASGVSTEGDDAVWIDLPESPSRFNTFDGMNGTDTAILDLSDFSATDGSGYFELEYRSDRDDPSQSHLALLEPGYRTDTIWYLLYRFENFTIIGSDASQAFVFRHRGEIENLHILAGGGDDYIGIRDWSEVSRTSGGHVIDAGDGNDTIHAGYGDVVEGGNGFDVLGFSLYWETIDTIVDLTTGVGAGAPWTGLEGGGGDFGSGDDLFVPGILYFTSNGGLGEDRIVLDFSSTDGFVNMNLQNAEGDHISITFETDDPAASRQVSIFSFEEIEIIGTDRSDTLVSTSSGGIVNGLDGDDRIYGNAGSDLLIAGPGDDTFIDVGLGDYLDGGDGYDTVFFDLSSLTQNLVIDGRSGQYGNQDWVDIEIVGGGALGSGDDTVVVGGALFANLDGNDGVDLIDIDYRGSAYFGNPITSVSLHQNHIITIRYATTFRLVYVDEFEIFNLAGTSGNDTLFGGAFSDQFFGSEGDDRLYGLEGDDLLEGGEGDDYLSGGLGQDIASYATASSGVVVDLTNESSQDTVGAGLDTLHEVESLIGSAHSDSLTGNDLANRFTGGLGDDVIDGDANIDTVQVTGNRSAYSVSQLTTGVFQVVGPDGTDTLTNVEYLQFDDQTLRLLPGTGVSVNFETADPSVYQDAMNAIRDFDGNVLGGDGAWLRIGSADVDGDGDIDQILVNDAIGRFATVGGTDDGLSYFDDHGWAGETRVVGIYIDPLVQSGDVEPFSDNDSQRRFQNDLQIENINRVLGADDYDGDGLQEVYLALTDGTAYLHLYMHADGNIQYANYQSDEQVIEFLTANGYTLETWADWFPDTVEAEAAKPTAAEPEGLVRPEPLILAELGPLQSNAWSTDFIQVTEVFA